MTQAQKLLIALCVTTSFSAKALVSPDISIWKDGIGLVPATQCEFGAQTQSFNRELENFSRYVIEITDLQRLDLAGSEVTLGNFLQAEYSNGEKAVLRCRGKEHLIFQVHSAKSLIPIARVAVSSDDLELFKYVKLHSSVEAERAIQEKSNQALENTSSIVRNVDAVAGSMEHVVCTVSGNLNVRDQSLNQVLFKVPQYARLLPVQSFGTDEFQKIIRGVTYTFVKVQFPDRPAENNTGWIAEDFLKLVDQCPGARESLRVGETIANLASSAWIFPTIKRPSSSYETGARKFGAGRSGGRAHAACDLYRVTNETARAVTAGTVIRGKYYFYEGTYALEVKHAGGKVVRYGEITGTSVNGVSSGSAVTTGQTIGYIGKVNSGCCTPMLHFEMYAGTKTGPLTTSGNKYRRRSDLIDPTSYLNDWERATFGASY